MTENEIKEANRYYWIVKGQLIPESWSEEDVFYIYTSYFRRMWGNHECVVHEEDFERMWAERNRETLKNVAVLGYN
jgi:hypothetical protein